MRDCQNLKLGFLEVEAVLAVDVAETAGADVLLVYVLADVVLTKPRNSGFTSLFFSRLPRVEAEVGRSCVVLFVDLLILIRFLSLLPPLVVPADIGLCLPLPILLALLLLLLYTPCDAVLGRAILLSVDL